MKTLLSFIGSNDAGTFLEQRQDGAVLSILKERKFQKIFLFYNSNGEVKYSSLSYKELAEKLKKEIISRGYCSEENVITDEIQFEDIADYSSVYPVLLNKLQTLFSESDFIESDIYAAISSGTPAMQTSWVLIAEANINKLKLIRSVEQKHSKNSKYVKDINLLTGTKDKLDELQRYRNLKIPKSSVFTIVDSTILNETQTKIALESKPILIYGETGTGKEVFAQSIHNASGRKSFIAVNCGAMSENLLESELFGHTKGAFTGAFFSKKGIVEEYSKGTLLLDEINSMPLSVQVKLLRFLENGEFRPLGSNKTQVSNIRIIAASNQNIAKLVSESKFREDLYYRLRTFEFNLLPLREKQDEIPNLIYRFLPNNMEISNEAVELLKKHKYKGNIRELKIILERASILGNKINSAIIRKILQEFSLQEKFSEIEIPQELYGNLFKLLRTAITNAALSQTNGNTVEAAKILGVTHPSIAKWRDEEIVLPHRKTNKPRISF